MLCLEKTMRLLTELSGLMLLGAVLLVGCGEGEGGGDADGGDTSGTEESDSEGQETDTGNGAAGTRISSIVGKIQTAAGAGWEGKLTICIPACIPLKTDKDGAFSLPVGTPYKIFDFDGVMAPFHLTILDSSGSYAAYGTTYSPNQEQVSDQGADDFEYDLGTLVLYELPEEKIPYTAADGASVDLSGVSFELPPESLIGREFDMEAKEFIDIPAEAAEIKVFKAPLDTWQPPFDDVGLDALYYIAPRWAKLAGAGVTLSIEPPAGWSEGDKGTLYILADDVPGLSEMAEYIATQKDGVCMTSTDILEKEPGGELANCGTVEMVGGRLITAPIPRLSWIGISK